MRCDAGLFLDLELGIDDVAIVVLAARLGSRATGLGAARRRCRPRGAGLIRARLLVQVLGQTV